MPKLETCDVKADVLQVLDQRLGQTFPLAWRLGDAVTLVENIDHEEPALLFDVKDTNLRVRIDVTVMEKE